MKAFQVVMYHDSEFNAAERDRVVGEPGTFAAARALARANLSDYWQTAAIYQGHMERNEYTDLDEFVDDELVRWYVGPDWCDREATT